jgi:signal transduction histidine kinase
MATSVPFQKLQIDSHYLSSLDISSFCQLQSEQLTSQHPIFFARIIYYNSCVKKHEEVISYANKELSFSQNFLAYLRSEVWLTNYPHTFTINEFNLEDLQSISYICPIGYRNQKPEYVQIISHEPLSFDLQKYLLLCTALVSKYIDINSENIRQKSEIKLLEQIIHKVGHQLRNSLALIKLYAQNLYLGLIDNPWQEQATVICESIQELDTSLTELLNCGQGVKLKVSLHDLRSVVSESINGLEPLIKTKQIKVLIPDTSTMVAIDRLQIKQVFDNILSNAVYFSPDSGTVTCSWQIFQGEVLIKISDQGPGLSQEDLQKIFTPFYSRRQGGTGLGLTIAKKIVLDHQGSLWGQSLSGGGAQFCLILPRPRNV